MVKNGGMVSPEPATDPLTEAWRLQKLGVEVMNVGKLSEAVHHLRSGLKLTGWQEGQPLDPPSDFRTVAARLLISLAYAESEQGRHQYGLSLLDMAEPLTPEESLATLAQQRGVVTHRAGRLEQALEYYDIAEPLLEKNGPVWQLVILLLNRSVSFAELGRTGLARSDLRRCSALADENDLPVPLAKAWHARGRIEAYSGNIPAALSIFDRAARQYLEHAPGLEPQVLLNKTQALLDAGLLREAAVLCDQIIDDHQETGRTWWGLAIVHIHRAQIALEIETPEAALRAAQQAEIYAGEIGSAFSISLAERLRREAELQIGEVSPGYVLAVSALANRLAEVGDPLDAGVAWMLAAKALVMRGDLPEAERILRKSNRGHRTDGHHFRTLRRLTWAELEVARSDRSAALTHLRIGLNQLHEHRARLGSMEMQAGMTSLGRKLAEKGLELVVDSGRVGTIFSWSERSRAQAFRLPPASPPEDSEIAEILARVRKLRNEIREAELVGDPVAELRSQCRVWERQLREHSWHASGSGKSVPLVKLGRVQEELTERGQALISFVADRGHLHALVLNEDRTSHVRLGPVDEVAEANRRLLVDLTAATGRKLPGRMLDVVRRSIQHQATVLGKVLLEPLLPLVGDRDLVVVPAQAMASLPWGVLPQLAGRPVTVSPSASVWWSAVRRGRRRVGPTLLASGPDLTHAEEELTAIARLRPDSLVLRDKDATPSAILASLDGAALAHLAAHGYHEPENVLFSRLDFADGPLMAYDIARLSKPPAHVTLSACDVGQSTVTIGDESLGFTAALLHAGTDTVVSSVTKVEHSAAADVMTAYHAGLVAGHRPARALAEASARQPFTSFVCYGAG